MQPDLKKDYYSTLGVLPSASAAEIVKAYRDFARVYHPDKNNGDSSAFKEGQEAFDVLYPKDTRAIYDSGRKVEVVIRAKVAQNSVSDFQRKLDFFKNYPETAIAVIADGLQHKGASGIKITSIEVPDLRRTYELKLKFQFLDTSDEAHIKHEEMEAAFTALGAPLFSIGSGKKFAGVRECLLSKESHSGICAAFEAEAGAVKGLAPYELRSLLMMRNFSDRFLTSNNYMAHLGKQVGELGHWELAEDRATGNRFPALDIQKSVLPPEVAKHFARASDFKLYYTNALELLSLCRPSFKSGASLYAFGATMPRSSKEFQVLKQIHIKNKQTVELLKGMKALPEHIADQAVVPEYVSIVPKL